MAVKSERLKKLETELQDLDQWLKLGLVPKKDLEKHKQEMTTLKEKIEEEKGRLRFLKESGAMEEYVPPKKSPHNRQALPDTASLPDVEGGDNNMTDAGLDMETESYDFDSGHSEDGESSSHAGSMSGEDDEETSDDDGEDPFSDKNRWKRGVMEDPDTNDW